MHFKLIVAFVDDSKTDIVMKAAREAGATGATVINNARGEGMNTKKTFFGMSLETQRDVLLFVVEQHLCRHILETIDKKGKFDETTGTGIAFSLDIDDVVGVQHQVSELYKKIEDEI